MERILISTDQLSAASNDLGTELAQMRTTANKMYEAVSVLGTMWEGPAHDALNTQFAQDHTWLLGQLDFLGRYIQELEQAERDYNSCDAWVKSEIAAVQI